jgi:hypothetical protein
VLMNTWYELWDSESANLIGAYRTEQEALQVLHKALVDYGPATFAGLVLTEEDDESDDPRIIAAGPDLIRYVEETLSAVEA